MMLSYSETKKRKYFWDPALKKRMDTKGRDMATHTLGLWLSSTYVRVIPDPHSKEWAEHSYTRVLISEACDLDFYKVENEWFGAV